MTSRIRRRLSRVGDDAGVALITVLLLMAVLAALGSTVAVMTVNNTNNASADRQAGAAMNVSEAGIAAAIGYIRNYGTGSLPCTAATVTPCWGDSANPQVVSAPGAAGAVTNFRVWIETVSALQLTGSGSPGTYRVHSTGTTGSNPGTRLTAVDLQVDNCKYPLGVFAHVVNPGGTGGVYGESIYTDGCVFKRSKINFTNPIDLVTGVHTGVHSTKVITDSQGTGSNCPANDFKAIHAAGVCNTTYAYDQDSLGGPLGTTACSDTTATGLPGNTSYLDNATLYSQYHFQAPGLTATQLNLLRTASQAQGFYTTSSTAIPAALTAANAATLYPHPILFYDFKGAAVGSSVSLSGLTAYSRSSPAGNGAAGCSNMGVVVVVVDGNVTLNANTTLVASVFAISTDPNLGFFTKLNGTANLIGTVYANNIDETGTGNITMDGCFLANPPGNLLNITTTNFREVDR
ncbi:MAG: hypothetical protein NVSMB13_03970 [Mycobacteriales bacterium]